MAEQEPDDFAVLFGAEKEAGLLSAVCWWEERRHVWMGHGAGSEGPGIVFPGPSARSPGILAPPCLKRLIETA